MLHISNSPEETEAIAAELATTLQPGDCIALDGELGAGKTQFVRGLVRGLGGPPNIVSSPTFVLLNIYRGGRIPVFHLDAYRIHCPADMEAIGFAELLEQNGIVVVEWAEHVSSLLPHHCIRIQMSWLGDQQRRIQIAHPMTT